MFKVSLHDLKGDNLWKKKKKKNKKQKWITDGVVEIQLNQNVECTSGLSGRREKASVWGQNCVTATLTFFRCDFLNALSSTNKPLLYWDRGRRQSYLHGQTSLELSGKIYF